MKRKFLKEEWPFEIDDVTNKNFQDSRPKDAQSSIVRLKTDVTKLTKGSHGVEEKLISVASNMNNDELESADHLGSSDLSICENMAQAIPPRINLTSPGCFLFPTPTMDISSDCTSARNDINVNLDDAVDIDKDGSFVHGLKRTVSWVGRNASDGYEREEYYLTAKDGNHLG